MREWLSEGFRGVERCRPGQDVSGAKETVCVRDGGVHMRWVRTAKFMYGKWGNGNGIKEGRTMRRIWGHVGGAEGTGHGTDRDRDSDATLLGGSAGIDSDLDLKLVRVRSPAQVLYAIAAILPAPGDGDGGDSTSCLCDTAILTRPEAGIYYADVEAERYTPTAIFVGGSPGCRDTTHGARAPTEVGRERRFVGTGQVEDAYHDPRRDDAVFGQSVGKRITRSVLSRYDAGLGYALGTPHVRTFLPIRHGATTSTIVGPPAKLIGQELSGEDLGCPRDEDTTSILRGNTGRPVPTYADGAVDIQVQRSCNRACPVMLLEISQSIKSLLERRLQRDDHSDGRQCSGYVKGDDAKAIMINDEDDTRTSTTRATIRWPRQGQRNISHGKYDDNGCNEHDDVTPGDRAWQPWRGRDGHCKDDGEQSIHISIPRAADDYRVKVLGYFFLMLILEVETGKREAGAVQMDIPQQFYARDCLYGLNGAEYSRKTDEAYKEHAGGGVVARRLCSCGTALGARGSPMLSVVDTYCRLFLIIGARALSSI
ncbi:hypothetical protein BJV78DRAFT_1152222 [Lactifluus subvellereus]|nr:hypothetical protein BJV78DRAFT_1152222 [Lactifluus subvellereus]